MKEFRFSGNAADALHLISSGLTGITIDCVSGSQIVDVILWLTSGGKVTILNRMHDVMERFEVGTLDFELDNDLVGSEKAFALPAEFNGQLAIERLVLEDPAVRAESGIVIRARNERQITIVAAAAPCILSVDVPTMGLAVAAPEYPIDTYVAHPL